MERDPFTGLPRRVVAPMSLVPLLRAAIPEDSPEAAALIQKMSDLIDAGESMTIDLDTGDVYSMGKTTPPRIYVVKR